MVNFSFVLSLTLILIFQDIMILNEETLILICFLTFNWLIYKNYGYIIDQELQNRKNLIEKNLHKSFNYYYLVLNTNIQKNQNRKNLTKSVEKLKLHLIDFNNYLLKLLPLYKFSLYQLTVIKKLIFFKTLEQQTFKLILLLLLKKIEKIVYTNNFFISKLKINYFLSVYKVNIREYLKLID